MAQITHGEVSVSISEDLPIPAEAGKLSYDQVLAIPKPPRGIGAATADTAEAMRKAAGKFIAPADVTPDVLEKAGEHAEDIDHIIASLEVVLANLKQANLLLDGKAWELLRKVNDQVNAQGKTNPEILTMFLPLTRYMKRFGRTTRRKTPTT